MKAFFATVAIVATASAQHFSPYEHAVKDRLGDAEYRFAHDHHGAGYDYDPAYHYNRHHEDRHYDELDYHHRYSNGDLHMPHQKMPMPEDGHCPAGYTRIGCCQCVVSDDWSQPSIHGKAAAKKESNSDENEMDIDEEQN